MTHNFVPESSNEAGLNSIEKMLLDAARQALNYISNTESEMGITLASGDSLRRAISIAERVSADYKNGKQP